jgi:2,4-dienoyl-CoA reductase-like NADH-dependent reductase (Old Yellow Enzyme family)
MTKGVDMPFLDLFAALRVGSLQLKNRIVMAPISTNFASPERPGFVSERHIAY